ncbi:twin-arginine translocase TatA/TatE family subunit [Azospirillum sp. RWY-5-1]|uniref:Sec-independent protein translocase protein TatA n=1 Tax=Azospirillum oleiclasticum TaxID=2735135 RepID=A0ABX2TEL8_9PROT|nr:twin-arginine translocase TatA/TatE family subunit [Azospirillum oleiclasticum]NYZ14256.1 twin-arginine translocase TatA/TatE family subunit [Azospirillum oleiclasticum]NYZ21741.1 twin-arginine translocase TatA/TatE family subunit [Azospirillum oleiclasticum]
MGLTSIWHWLIVLLIVLLLFGAGKLPKVMGDLAKGIKNFKAGLKDESDDDPASAATPLPNQATTPPPPVNPAPVPPTTAQPTPVQPAAAPAAHGTQNTGTTTRS